MQAMSPHFTVSSTGGASLVIWQGSITGVAYGLTQESNSIVDSSNIPSFRIEGRLPFGFSFRLCRFLSVAPFLLRAEGGFTL